MYCFSLAMQVKECIEHLLRYSHINFLFNTGRIEISPSIIGRMLCIKFDYKCDDFYFDPRHENRNAKMFS